MFAALSLSPGLAIADIWGSESVNGSLSVHLSASQVNTFFFEGKYFNLHLIKEVKNNFNADCTVVIFISMNKLKINSWILSQSFKNRVYLFSFKIRIPWKYESGQNWALILVSHIFITHWWCFLPAPCRVPQQTHTSDLTSEMQCINSKLQLGKCVLQYRCFEK